MIFVFLRQKKILFFSLAIFFASNFFFAEEISVITINRADSSEYKKNESSGEEEIVLKGSVSLSVEKEKTKMEITAEYVSFNRSTQMLFARENVKIIKNGTKDSSSQEMSATSVLLNTGTLEGIFDGGKVVQLGSDEINLPSGSTMIVASKIFGRDSSGTVAFKKADLTFCDDENPHWKIKASRIWLLPGGEFAFLNALVFVGKIPVFYLPAFYYPKDELLFNPSFGYSERLGYYIQTTTYIRGRKPLYQKESDDETKIADDLFNFMRPSTLKEQRREGLVLHNLDSDYEGDTENYFKIMGDYYSNIGATVGFGGKYNGSGEYVSLLESSLMLAFSNTVFYRGGAYSSYSSGGKIEKDSADFLGIQTPFRYNFDFKFSLKKPFTLDVSMPVLSDPYFTEDFGERNEYMDWISFLLGNDDDDDDDDEDTSDLTTSFEWNGKITYKIPVPEFAKPFVTNFSVTNLSTNFVFNSVSRSDDAFTSAAADWQTYTPERSFFYPSQVTPVKIALKIEGEIFKFPREKKYKKFDAPAFPFDLEIPDELKTQKQKDEEKNSAEKNDSDSAENSGEKKSAENDDVIFSFDELSPDDIRAKIYDVKGIDYLLTYSVAPEFVSQVTYNSSEFQSAEDFQWGALYSTYFQIKSPLTISSDFAFRSPFLAAKNDLVFEPLYQKHPSLKGYDSESLKDSVTLADYNARKLDLTGSNDFSFKPFIYSDVFRESTLAWKSTIKIVRTEFIGDAKNPEWDYVTAKLTDEEAVTAHVASATLAAGEGKNLSQKITFSSNLPPQTDEYTLNADFTFPHLTFSAEAGLEQESAESEDFVWKPFRQSASLNFFDGKLSFTESYNYEMEEKHADSMKLAASWKNLQLAYTMQYATGYDFDDDWIARSEKEFLPYSLSLSYGSAKKNFRYWKNRITWAPSLTTGIVYDFIKPTDSYFKFAPSVTFRVNDEFDFSFTAESQNSVIFRYFQKYTPYGEIIPGEENLLTDLLNSFAFWGDDCFYDPDQTKRRSSGFKIKSLKASVTRNLHDWDMTASISFKPRAVTGSDGKKSYDYHPYITFAISWHPMPSLKTSLIDDYGEWELE